MQKHTYIPFLPALDLKMWKIADLEEIREFSKKKWHRRTELFPHCKFQNLQENFDKMVEET